MRSCLHRACQSGVVGQVLPTCWQHLRQKRTFTWAAHLRNFIASSNVTKPLTSAEEKWLEELRVPFVQNRTAPWASAEISQINQLTQENLLCETFLPSSARWQEPNHRADRLDLVRTLGLLKHLQEKVTPIVDQIDRDDMQLRADDGVFPEAPRLLAKVLRSVVSAGVPQAYINADDIDHLIATYLYGFEGGAIGGGQTHMLHASMSDNGLYRLQFRWGDRGAGRCHGEGEDASAAGVVRMLQRVFLELFEERRTKNVGGMHCSDSADDLDISADCLSHAMSLLDAHGVCIFHNAVSKEWTQAVHKLGRHRLDTLEARLRARFGMELTQVGLEGEGFSNLTKKHQGRYTCKMSPPGLDSQPCSDDFPRIDATPWDRVLRQRGFACFPGSSQFVSAIPGSQGHEWHTDSATFGDEYTVLIPLTDVTLDLGPTKVLPGSHRWSHLRCALTLLANSGVRCHVPVGSAVVLDGRTLHGACPNRGQTNREIQIFFYHREPSRPLLFGKEEL